MNEPLFTTLNPYSTFALLCILDRVELARAAHGYTHPGLRSKREAIMTELFRRGVESTH